MRELTDKIQDEIRRVIIGKDEVIGRVLMAILAKGHVLLEDVPGVGKTTMAMAFARVLGLTSKRVQFTSDTMPSDIIGFSVYDREAGKLSYKPGAVMTNLLLADEINRTSSKTQSALLEAMEERRVTVDGITHVLPEPFVVLATQNPAGSAGTQMLPASQLDRFLMRLSMGYPDRQNQIEIMKGRHHEDPLELCRAVTDTEELETLISEVRHVYVSDAVYDYISALAESTRKNIYVQLGISPRGALALCNAAKSAAYLKNRDYVIPDDVESVIKDVCAHRLILSSKARLREYTAGMIIEKTLEETEKPQMREFGRP